MQRDVPTVLLQEVFHVGTLNPQHRRPVTTHGDGISVGLDPVAWARRLRAPHAATFRMVRRDGSPMRFADIDSFTEEQRRGIMDWAIDCGYVREIPVWLVEKPEVARRWPLTSHDLSTSRHPDHVGVGDADDAGAADGNGTVTVEEHLPADITDRPGDPALAFEPPSADPTRDWSTHVPPASDEDWDNHPTATAKNSDNLATPELQGRRNKLRARSASAAPKATTPVPRPTASTETGQPEAPRTRMVRWPLPEDLSLLDAHARAEREGGRLVVDTRLRVTDTIPEPRVMKHRDPTLYAYLSFVRVVRPDLDGAWWGSKMGWLPQGSLMRPSETYEPWPGMTDASLRH